MSTPAYANEIRVLSSVAPKLGISEAVRAKAGPAATGDEVNANITNGAADLAVLPISEILPVPGAELRGVFSAQIQSDIVMAAGISTRSNRAAAGAEFVAFLRRRRTHPCFARKAWNGSERQPFGPGAPSLTLPR